jgi:hypothetical protein
MSSHGVKLAAYNNTPLNHALVQPNCILTLGHSSKNSENFHAPLLHTIEYMEIFPGHKTCLNLYGNHLILVGICSCVEKSENQKNELEVSVLGAPR